MRVTITNLSSTAPVYLSSFYTTLAPSGAITTPRTMAQIDADASLKALIVASSVSVAFLEDPGDDIAGGGGLDSGIAEAKVITKAFAAGAGGAADDVVIFSGIALQSSATPPVPYNFVVLDVTAIVTTAVSGSTLQLRDTLAGAGTTLSDALASATTGVKRNTTATTAPAVVKGGTLVIRRSDSGIAGRVSILVARSA